MIKNLYWSSCKVTVILENCALLGCYAASSGKFLTDVSGQHIGPIFRVPHSVRNHH